ncbi:MAG: hypothetical protein FJ150_09590 [Euryarchaeota archaeon]|nr:hypothetical protein [Euryarchaeota archaeon]
MSGICGIVNFDGRPVDPEILHRMAEFIAYRGPDGINYWIEGNVGLVHLALHTTPESQEERQPLLSKDEDFVLVADARLDNRNELIPVLKEKGLLRGREHTDADLILAAYQCWGENCPKHIIGDFAFAIWDNSLGRIFIARDVVGLRQLFYSMHDNSLYFASAVQPIAHVLPKLPSLNTKLMQDFLHRFYDRWACQTIYNGILRLPPAHSFTVKDGSTRRQLYYIFGQQPKPNFSSDEEWIKAFCDLFDEILKNQLRSITPIGIWVSGGLDSSSLACEVYDLRKKCPDLPEIRFYSGIFEETPSQDEKHFFDSVAERCAGAPVKFIKSDNYWSFCELGKDDGFPLDEPEVWELRGHTRASIKATANDGCLVYLTGLGSDDLFGLSFYNLPISLRDVRLKDWLQEAAFFRQKGKISWLKLIYRAYLSPLIPESVKYMLWIFRHGNNRTLPWLKGQYTPPNPNNCNIKKFFMKPTGISHYGLVAYQMLRFPWFVAHFDMFGLMNASAGVELRLPYLDRRMIEFLISIPNHLRSWKGVDRVLLRESMKGILPELVRTRKDKPSATELYERGFYKENVRIKTLLQNSYLEKLGFVDSKKLNQELKLLEEGKHDNIKYLSWFITLETWLREQEELRIEPKHKLS